MNNARILPLARNGTTGVCNEFVLEAAEQDAQMAFMAIPERIASIGWQVSIPRVAGNIAHIVIETSMNTPDTIGDNGTGGVWCNVYSVDNIIVLDANEKGVRRAIDGGTAETADGSFRLERAGGETIYANSNVYDTGCAANTVRGIRVIVLYSNCQVSVVFCG